ncbi:MAG: DUF58 domain-containing protein [Leptospiraceae bacterium]|nr:DUF58 domain-containing protein [Leptospiraceae bacterium]
MKDRIYKRYYNFYLFQAWIRNRFTTLGRFAFSILFLLFIFGLNTQKTLIYQIFCLHLSICFISILFSLKFKPTLEIQRILPKQCLVNKELHYTIVIKNKGKKKESNLFYKEEFALAVPTKTEFYNTIEPGEEKRNWFDRKMKFYRWKWLVQKKRNVYANEFPLPDLKSNEEAEIELSLMPLKRGYIHFVRSIVNKRDPFSFLKTSFIINQNNSILVLPKQYLISKLLFTGAKKYNQNDLTQTMKKGESLEFFSVREYQFGDPIKNIHWKTSAKRGQPMVKEFHDENLTRSSLILDTFTKEAYSDVFEEAVSLASSVILKMESNESLLDLMFVGDKSFCLTAGSGLHTSSYLLETLASIKPCCNQKFQILTNSVKNHIHFMSSVLLILISLNDMQIELIQLLEYNHIELRVYLIVDDMQKVTKQLETIQLKTKIKVLETSQIQEGLQTE